MKRRPPTVVTDEMRREMLRLARTGMTNKAIAAGMGVAHQVVSRALVAQDFRRKAPHSTLGVDRSPRPLGAPVRLNVQEGPRCPRCSLMYPDAGEHVCVGIDYGSRGGLGPTYPEGPPRWD